MEQAKKIVPVSPVSLVSLVSACVLATSAWGQLLVDRPTGFGADVCFGARSAFDEALDRFARDSADPERARGTLLARLRGSSACLRPDLTPDQLVELFRRWNAGELPASVMGHPNDGIQPRFQVAAQTYVGAGTLGPSGTATAASLTYSFPPDVLNWGAGGFQSEGPGNLNQIHIATWGANNTDVGREYIRQGLAAWRRWCGLTYTEVIDNGRPWTPTSGPMPGVGDTRIGGANVANPNFIAYNNFPANGGDMFIDTFQFTGLNFYTSPANTLRNLRNTMSHEHGHGLGKLHQIPCNNTKCMEPAVATGFDGIAVDDIRAGHRNFGDRFSGNHTPATAKNFGDITGGPTGKSLRFPMLSTNGAFSPTNPTGADWFTIDSSVGGRTLVVRARPVGGTYNTGGQMAVPGNICAGANVPVNASQAGDLRVDFFIDPNGAPTFSSFAGGPGVDESFGLALGTGTRYIRVMDVGPNPAANQTVQLYDLEILINTVPSDPIAIAGVNKIAYVGERCDFYPAINSQATEPGATLTAFQYDLDGDTIFETSGAIGSTTYNTPGVRNVTVRAIDSNGKFADDTITVNVLSLDNCDGAKQIYVNQPMNGTTAGATTGADAAHECVSSGSDAGVWYRFVPAATAVHNIFTCPQVVDTVVSVHSGACGSLTNIGCNDDDSGICPPSIRASNIPNLVLNAGQSYYIKVSGFLNASGTFTLNVTQPGLSGSCCTSTGLCSLTDQANCLSGSTWSSGGVCLPNTCSIVNDPCSGAIALSVNASVSGSTFNVPSTDPDTSACAFGMGRGVWFTFTPAKTTRYQISTCGSNYNNLLNVFTNPSCPATTSLTCNNDSSANRPCPDNGFAARVPSVQLTAGTTYRILLGGIFFGGTSWDAGNYTIVVRCVADFNEDGSVAIQDIFDFLNAWFAGNLAADANASGGLSVQDIFDFLNAWFLGC